MESSSEECVNAGLGEGRGIVIPESFCCIHSNTYEGNNPHFCVRDEKNENNHD